MTLNELKHQARVQDWSAAIQECRGSGVPVKQWCRSHGVHPTTYYRWERSLLKESMESGIDPAPSPDASFVELSSNLLGTDFERIATVRINDVMIDIYPGIDEHLLLVLLKALKSC